MKASTEQGHRSYHRRLQLAVALLLLCHTAAIILATVLLVILYHFHQFYVLINSGSPVRRTDGFGADALGSERVLLFRIAPMIL